MEKLIANHLLEIKAVFLSPNEPFTWASGIKSPIYCDNRLTLSYPNVRKDVAKGLAELIKKEFPKTEVVMGTATAGIPHAAFVSDILDLPMGYVRGSSKAHGRNNQIEGKLEVGQKVVIVEDLISTGGSSIEVVNSLREFGAEVLGVVSIFTYNMPKAEENFKNANCKYAAVTNYDELVKIAIERNDIKDSDYQKLVAWKQNPSDPSWMDK